MLVFIAYSAGTNVIIPKYSTVAAPKIINTNIEMLSFIVAYSPVFTNSNANGATRIKRAIKPSKDLTVKFFIFFVSIVNAIISYFKLFVNVFDKLNALTDKL